MGGTRDFQRNRITNLHGSGVLDTKQAFLGEMDWGIKGNGKNWELFICSL